MTAHAGDADGVRDAVVVPSDVDDDGDVVAALSAAGRVMVALTARSIAQLDVDLTLPQYRVLVVLAAGAQRAVDLAAELAVSPSTVTRTCDRLVRRGLIRRFRRADDRRASWVALTDEGRRLIAAVMRRRRTEIVRLVRAAAMPDPRAVARGLAAFVAAAGEPSEEAWWRQWETAAVPASTAVPTTVPAGTARPA